MNSVSISGSLGKWLSQQQNKSTSEPRFIARPFSGVKTKDRLNHPTYKPTSDLCSIARDPLLEWKNRINHPTCGHWRASYKNHKEGGEVCAEARRYGIEDAAWPREKYIDGVSNKLGRSILFLSFILFLFAFSLQEKTFFFFPLQTWLTPTTCNPVYLICTSSNHVIDTGPCNPACLTCSSLDHGYHIFP